MKALILAPFSDRYLDRLRGQLEVVYEPWIESRTIQNPKELAVRLHNEDIAVLVVEADFLFEDIFAVPNLKLAAVCRKATQQVDLAAATRHGVPVIHTPGRNAVGVAELTIGMMIALARQIPRGHAFVSTGQWTNPMDSYISIRGRELAGSTVGIIGLGFVGAEVARLARCFDARVLVSDPYVPKRRAEQLGAKLTPLRQLLKRSDFVSLHVTKTKDTDGMIDGAALDLMKPTAYFVNTSQGSAVDHEALVEHLRDRRIAGAAFDVYASHTLPGSDPLTALDNVILTPHIGGATDETIDRQSRMVTQEIERFLRGKPPRRLANPDVLKQPIYG